MNDIYIQMIIYGIICCYIIPHNIINFHHLNDLTNRYLKFFHIYHNGN